MVDAMYGESTETVYKVCEERKGKLWFPSHGIGHGAKRTPFSEFKKRDQEWVGPNARIPLLSKTKRSILYFLYETNFWKSFCAGHWAIPAGDDGAFTFFDGNQQMPVDQLHAEKMTMVKANNREVGEWELKPSRPDNHLFDCCVGCCVGASYLGCEEPGLSDSKQRKKSQKPITQADVDRAFGIA
jgi:hypothetical protein